MKEAVSVTQLNRYIKELINDDVILKNVLVKGEVSNFKESKGNYYFSLKDESSYIQCIVFTQYSGINVDVNNLNDGSKVIVEGKVSVYDRNGTYAIYVSSVTNVGIGNYFLELEKLKKKLLDLGMFDSMYKKEIPKYSSNIGVVTAENGAAIRDIFKTIKDKNPYANVYLYPSMVQGDEAYKSIIEGIMVLDKMALDVIIIGRGGGSIEDLYCFNDERVAYAIFNAKTPIISAVGHEINDSISDLVADLRVATPTAAGEAATFDYYEFVNDIENYKLSLDNILDDKLSRIYEKINIINEKIKFLSPKTKVLRYKERLIETKKKIDTIMNNRINNTKMYINHFVELLKKLNILDKLSSGLLYTTDESDKKILSIKQVEIGDIIKLRLSDGMIKSKVISKKGAEF